MTGLTFVHAIVMLIALGIICNLIKKKYLKRLSH